jgi:hypothetical protein
LDDEGPEPTAGVWEVECGWVDMVEMSGEDDMVIVVVTVMLVMLGDVSGILLSLLGMDGTYVTWDYMGLRVEGFDIVNVKLDATL